MNAEETKSLIPYAEAAEKKWFLNHKPAKPVKEVNVRFTNGKSYRYLSKIECTPDDVLTIDYGGATSCCMGQVEKVGGIEHLKPLSAIRTLFVFSTDPGKREIKRNVSAYKAMDSKKLITDYNSYACCIVDRFIAKVLDSITVLAFPEFVDDEAIAEAKKYLETKCFLPAELIRENQTRNLDIVFPGYYPGWLEDFKSLNFWNKDFVKKIFFMHMKAIIAIKSDFLITIEQSEICMKKTRNSWRHSMSWFIARHFQYSSEADLSISWKPLSRQKCRLTLTMIS